MLVVATIALQWPWLNLHDDVRFTLGPLRAAEVPWPALDAFVHRPMANRVVMAGLDALTAGPLPLREKLTVAWAVVGVAVAAAVLQTALLRRTDRVVATVVPVAVFGSLAWASEAYVLQPEWTATVLGVAALGLALWPTPTTRPSTRRVLLGVAAAVIAVAVLQKYTTLTVAALVVGVVWTVDRRRAWWLALVAGLTTVGLFGLTLLVGAREWQWFTETPRLNPAAGLRLDAFREWAVNWVWNNPILLLWPAAAALAAALTGRRIWVVGSGVAFGGVLAAIVVQNQFFGYHGTPLLPVAAGVGAYAVAVWTQQRRTLLVALVPLAAWVLISRAVLGAPIAWRFAYQKPMAGWLLLVVLVVAGTAWAQRRSTAGGRSSRRAAAATAALLSLVVSFPGWPATPYGFFGQDRSRRSEVARQAELITDAAAIRAVVGESPVVYLADGETVYVVGSRTRCPYPAAVVLYRSDLTGVGDLRSFADNLACLRDPTARFLILQTWRVPFDWLDPRVAEAVTSAYDCDRAASVREILVCPRR